MRAWAVVTRTVPVGPRTVTQRAFGIDWMSHAVGIAVMR